MKQAGNTEIERKWLLDGFPDLPVQMEAEVEQGYLSFVPATVRIRKRWQGGGVQCWLTIKGKGTLTRTEVELPLAESQYDALLPLVVAPTARKKYRTYRLPGGETLECSLVDEGEATSFYYAEVEFPSEAAARAFQPPAFLGREVTEEPGYTMAAYSRRKGETGRHPPV